MPSAAGSTGPAGSAVRPRDAQFGRPGARVCARARRHPAVDGAARHDLEPRRDRFAARGAWRLPCPPAPLRCCRNRLTMRSSIEWKVTTASLPPGFSARSAACKPWHSWPYSSFTAMRIAWKLRVAGWVWPGLGRGRHGLRRSRPAGRWWSIGASRARARWRARSGARRVLRRSGTGCRQAPPRAGRSRGRAAVVPSAPIRMSSGPSRMNENPRSGWSSCIDETPRSSTTPSSGSAGVARQAAPNVPSTSCSRSP